MQANGYWYKSGKLFELKGQSHVGYIIEYNDKFGLDKDYIEELYASYGEKLNHEGKAREELIKSVARKGWIRIRRYTRPRDYWSIQYDDFRKRERAIKGCVEDLVLTEEIMSINDELILLGYDDDSNYQYSFMQGGAKAFLEEKKEVKAISVILIEDFNDFEESKLSFLESKLCAKDYIEHRLAKTKENTATRLKSALVGQNDLVQSFGIMTPENPMGIKSSDADNSKARNEFETKLEKMKYDYIPILGKYGNVEKSYFIININVDDLETLGYEYNQESFIYAEKEWSEDFTSSSMYFSYFQKGKGKKDKYDILSDADGISNTQEANDFFTSLKSYKFNIPFPIFESLLKDAQELLETRYSHINKENLVEGILENIYKVRYTLKHRLQARSFLYESEDAKIERYKRLYESASKREWAKSRLPQEVLDYKEKGLLD